MENHRKNVLPVRDIRQYNDIKNGMSKQQNYREENINTSTMNKTDLGEKKISNEVIWGNQNIKKMLKTQP